MNYYKPTTLFQKIWKVVRLYALYAQFRGSPRRRSISPESLSILMAVPTVDRIGGLEIQAKMIAASLAKAGHLVTLLSDRMDASPSREFVDGFLLHRIPAQSRGKVSLLLSLVRFLFKHRRQYSMVHAHGFTGFSLFAIRAAKWLKLPVVLVAQTRNDVSSIFSRSDAKHKRYQSWLNYVSTFIAISEELHREMISCGIPESKIEKIPNLVSAEKFAADPARRKALRLRYGIHDDRQVFLFLGRLVERKGAHILLRAWREMQSGVLWIVGEGAQENELKRHCAELHLHNVVFHGGTLTPADFYRSSDAFVLPSLEEGMPTVLLEAMSCGLPSIATRIGGVTDILENERQGLLVAPGSAEELAAALQRMASSSEDRQRWGMQARQTVMEKFDVASATPKYISLYRRLMSPS